MINYLIIGAEVLAAIVLVIIAIYSWIYFSQVEKIEKQFGLHLPAFVKKSLAVLAVLPMAVSLVVIVAVFIELAS